MVTGGFGVNLTWFVEVLLHNYTVRPYADPPITDVLYNETLSVKAGDVRPV